MKGGAERKGVHVPCGSPLFNPVEHVFFNTLISFYITAHWEQRAMPCWPDSCSYDVYNFSRADVHTLI